MDVRPLEEVMVVLAIALGIALAAGATYCLIRDLDNIAARGAADRALIAEQYIEQHDNEI